MRPKRASSWNISLIGPSLAQHVRISASRSGSFFPLLLSQWIALRVALVRSQLAPAVAVQQVVDRRERNRAAQGRLKLRLDLADHQNATRASVLQQWHEQLALLLGRHVLAPSAPARRALAIACDLAGQKAVAQAAGPGHRAADDARRLLQAQSVVQRQHHSLCLAQLLERLRLRQQVTPSTLRALSHLVS